MDNRIIKLLDYITSKGYECYVVGGFTRDYILNISSTDYDLCSNATPETLENILTPYNIISKNYGTITILIDELKVEITTYRKELIYEKRKPIKYEYINSLEEDLKRRDFTINTLCLDKNNRVIDLLHGMEDINNKIIRMVGNIDQKLTEDPLRILRALRFSATLGFKIDDELYIGMLKYKYLLKSLSYERKREEICKLINLKCLAIVKPFSESLDLNLDNIEYFDNDLLTLMTIDEKDNYIMNNKDKKLVNMLKKYRYSDLTDYDLYVCGFEIVNLLGELTHQNLKARYVDLVIKNRKDINITSNDLLKYFKNIELNNIYKDLEYKILSHELENNYAKIMSYLWSKIHTI